MPDQLVNPDTEVSDAVRETEFEILEEAFRDKPEKDEGQEAAAEPEGEPEKVESEPARDEQGRFAKAEPKAEPKDEKAETPASQQQAAPEGDKLLEGKEEEGKPVPWWRLREIAEERRQAQAEAQALRAELARLQVQRQQPQQPAEQQQEIDPLIDPQGFANKIRDEFQGLLRVEKLNNNLAIAHMRHGESFEKAYSALLKEGQNGNGQLVQHLTAQGNPGEAIVNWYKQGELLRETNGDLGAFKTKMREELLKDPEFIKAALEAARGIANGGQSQGQQGQRPNNITQLPPSLSRATGSAANSSDPIDTDDSDAAVFNFAFK